MESETYSPVMESETSSPPLESQPDATSSLRSRYYAWGMLETERIFLQVTKNYKPNSSQESCVMGNNVRAATLFDDLKSIEAFREDVKDTFWEMVNGQIGKVSVKLADLEWVIPDHEYARIMGANPQAPGLQQVSAETKNKPNTEHGHVDKSTFLGLGTYNTSLQVIRSKKKVYFPRTIDASGVMFYFAKSCVAKKCKVDGCQSGKSCPARLKKYTYIVTTKRNRMEAFVSQHEAHALATLMKLYSQQNKSGKMDTTVDSAEKIWVAGKWVWPEDMPAIPEKKTKIVFYNYATYNEQSKNYFRIIESKSGYFTATTVQYLFGCTFYDTITRAKDDNVYLGQYVKTMPALSGLKMGSVKLHFNGGKWDFPVETRTRKFYYLVDITDAKSPIYIRVVIEGVKERILTCLYLDDAKLYADEIAAKELLNDLKGRKDVGDQYTNFVVEHIERVWTNGDWVRKLTK
jgi:hypothetical protein